MWVEVEGRRACLSRRAPAGAPPVLAGALFAGALLLAPPPVTAQGPSLAAKQAWGTGRDVPGLFGAVLTLRPAGSGVSLSVEWLTGRGPPVSTCSFIPPCTSPPRRYDTRLLAGSVGYSARLDRVLGGDVTLRPSVGVANLAGRGDGKTFISFGTDAEASRPLFGLERLRGLLGLSGSVSIPFHNEHCVDCSIPSYDDGFQSIGLYLGLMMQMR